MTAEDILNSEAGARLFNGLTSMNLVRADNGHSVYFSYRRRLVLKMIDLILEEGYVPTAKGSINDN